MDVEAEVERLGTVWRWLPVGLALVVSAGCSSDVAEMPKSSVAPTTSLASVSSATSTTATPPPSSSDSPLPVPSDKPESQCDGNTIVYERCVAAVFKGVDDERVVLVAKILDHAASPNQTPGLVDLLRRAESAFVVYREETCDSVYQEYIGGTLRGALAQHCKIDLTRDHNRFLTERERGR